MHLISKAFVATLLIVTWFHIAEAETKSKIESTSQSIVSRLNPALRKALLKALTNIENEETTELNGIQETTEDELLEESTKADLKSLNLYNSYLTDGAKNFTQKNENEIIHTIILKKAKTTAAPIDSSRQDDQVIIQFGAPDPVKDSDVHIETVQIARSVKTNEIEDGDSDTANNNSDENQNDFEITTYKPLTTADTTTNLAETRKSSSLTTSTSTTTTTTTTTTEAPTHNEDGENIEKVSKNDVKIYQAPLVAAFTVQQDALGLPKNVIPLIHPVRTAPAVARPIQQFTISSSTSVNTTPKTPLINTTPLAQHLTLELPSVNNAPSFSLSKSLELPSTKEAAFTTFALDQKRKQLEEQIAQLQAQQRQTEETFRQRQAYQEQQALNRQQELLLQQRYRFEEENRARLHRYEQEQQLLRQQQFQNSHFLTNLPTLNHLTPPPADQSSSVQVIPSLSFPTQQLLPVREAGEFRSKPPTFTPSQPLPVFSNNSPLLNPNPQLPLKPAQQFISGITGHPALNNIDPITISDQTRSRNRVFRQESGTANFGLNSINTNFPPIYPIYNVDNQLQNLLYQSGVGGRSNEDLNIISKVLSLNHGIQLPTGTTTFYPTIQGRFIRSAPN
ncbi:ras guanine nucleotide exchange factor B-like [Contarinia nasturtii]|uniref:ras guanine nucleotide exchange factor B-like n=1 Tax=Contarinia nasturtii TaxID=265458 RepID=UPI0012D4B683|nr:ras guanine nucleotide exchange factor B-like [Contarinia nasturtii]